MIVVKKLLFNPFQENTYLVWDEETLEAMIVDPGCIDSYEEKVLSDFIDKRRLSVKYLIVTHSHIDHILGCSFVKNKYNVPFYAPEEDIPLLQNADKQGEAFGIEISKPPIPDYFITESLEMKLGNSSLKFLFTPGHTPGEYCIYFENENICLTGDVLFKGSIGRTDLWGGDYDTLLTSIKNKLLTLPDKVIIYPGHGESSSIGDEKKDNPFIINNINS